jgi:hypothetical protein
MGDALKGLFTVIAGRCLDSLGLELAQGLDGIKVGHADLIGNW